MDSQIAVVQTDVANIKSMVMTLERDVEGLNFENTRLSNERKQERDYFYSERASYEKSISELKNDLGEANSKILFNSSENEKLRKILDDRLKENSRLKEDIGIIVKEKNEILTNIVLIKTENDRLVHLLFEKISDYKSKVMDWHSQMGQLKVEMSQQIELLKTSYSNDKLQLEDLANSYRKEKEKLTGQLYESSKQIQELQLLNSNLSNEKERLMKSHQDRMQEIEIMNIRHSTILNQKHDEMEQNRERHEKEKRAALDQNSKDLMNKLQAEKQPLLAGLQQMKQKVLDYENNNKYLTVEVERLTQIVNEKVPEAEEWKAKFWALKDERDKQIEEISLEFETYKRAQIQGSDLEVKFKAERTSYETEIMQWKQRLQESESRNANLSNENQKLQILSVERMKEIEQWKNKMIAGGDYAELEALRRQIESLKKEGIDIKEKNLRLQAEKNRIETNISQLMQENDNKKKELVEAYELINSLKDERGGTNKEADIIRKEISMLKTRINNLEGDILIKTETNEHYRRENEELSKNILSLRNQISQNEQEIIKKNKELVEKIQELDVLKMKYEDALNSFGGNAEISKVKYSYTNKNMSMDHK